MTPEDPEYAEITERLVRDFSALMPFETIVAVLREHVSAHPDDSASLVEATTRMTLKVRRQGQENDGDHVLSRWSEDVTK
jgi:hypothetical protein